ncbi:MAG: tRNA (adenosine(37)-N6)-threonylcarbamoyltransferase complex ATPase subunit type 1 TsaE [Chloroflexia bacterium]
MARERPRSRRALHRAGDREPGGQPVVRRSTSTARPPLQHDLYHLDLYRIESLAEALAFGVDELLGGDNVCLVEWPDAAADALPGDRLEVWFEHVGEHNRSLKFRALGERAAHTLTLLQASLPSGY